MMRLPKLASLTSVTLASVVMTGAALTGCGYTPLYAPIQGQATAGLPTLTIGAVTMQNVQTAPGQRRVAQDVSRQLKQYYPDQPDSAALVTVTIEETTEALALQRTAAVQRAQLTLTGFITITAADGAEALKTSLSTTSAYNVENTPFASESGKSYARMVAARNLADAIARRLAIWAKAENSVQ